MAGPDTSAEAPAAADQGGVGVRIRMYRVGFGDFFLMSLPTATHGLAHVLIDCGVHAHDIKAMPSALQQLKADTNGQLALVIMTHRHADHISGFATGKEIFGTFQVERVWMSWFEDPNDAVAAPIQAGFTALAQRLTAAFAARGAPEDQYSRMAGNILGLAGGASSNDVALTVLRGFKTPSGAPTPVDYYRAGDPAQLPPSLVNAGLTAKILGPPTDLALVAQMDNKAHQYLSVASPDDGAATPPFAKAFTQTARPVWPARVAPLYDFAQIEQHIAANQPELLAAAAQSADNAINNQSLVVWFEFKGKTMLFCGDAQWGNWANFLFGGPIGSPGQAGLTETSRAILGSLDFYKVGHHGSTNANPIDVVTALKQGCVAMCSTDPGAYGDPSRGTEVPRAPLLAALDDRTQHQLARSDQVAAGSASITPGLGQLAPVFRPGPEGKYIDYSF